MNLDDLLFATSTASCVVIAWVAISFFLMRGEPRDLWSLVFQVGLIMVIASAASTPLALLQRGEAPSWWAVMQRVGGAVVAACLYENRFGVKRQILQLSTCCTERIAKIRAAFALLKGLRRGRKT